MSIKSKAYLAIVIVIFIIGIIIPTLIYINKINYFGDFSLEVFAENENISNKIEVQGISFSGHEQTLKYKNEKWTNEKRPYNELRIKGLKNIESEHNFIIKITNHKPKPEVEYIFEYNQSGKIIDNQHQLLKFSDKLSIFFSNFQYFYKMITGDIFNKLYNIYLIIFLIIFLVIIGLLIISYPKKELTIASKKITINSKKILFSIFLVLIVYMPLEIMSYLYIKYSRPEIKKIVSLLRSETDHNTYQNCVSVTYLNYIPNPGHSENGIIQHNEFGYRGNPVDLEKNEAVRILFMGGSTTYGSGVLDPAHTYPAQTEFILNKHYDHAKIEVINAGIPWGTSAEILTHYLMKFRYFKPDILIINTGGNDAQGNLNRDYQPDYSNWRRNLPEISPVNKFTRILLGSKFFSVISFHLFYSEFVYQDIFIHSGEKLHAKWYNNDLDYAIKNIDEYAFYRNISSVVHDAVNSEIIVIIMPFGTNPFYADNLPEKEYIEINTEVLKKIAKENNVFYVDFPYNHIPDNTWVDDCHLNIEGENIKARYVANFIIENNLINLLKHQQ